MVLILWMLLICIHHFRIVAVDDAVGKAVREVFSGVGFGIVSQRRGGSFCTKELFMLCRAYGVETYGSTWSELRQNACLLYTSRCV